MIEWPYPFPGTPLPAPAAPETGALQSLYGKGNAKRRSKAKAEKPLAGNVGGQAREQSVVTPGWIIQGLVAATQRPLVLDPCTLPTNPLRAPVFCTGTEAGGVDGLAMPWRQTAPYGFTYCNPPFNELKDWLVKCALEATEGTPIWLLCPFRPHREWFARPLRNAAVYGMRPFPFVGSKSAIPFPMILAGWNVSELRVLMNDKTKSRDMLLGRWSWGAL